MNSHTPQEATTPASSNKEVPIDYQTWREELEGDTLREECGVFGVFGNPDAAALTALGLHALQHRGQEAAGIVSYDGQRFNAERRMGLVGDHFSSEKMINRLAGSAAIGHNRYSTTGSSGMCSRSLLTYGVVDLPSVTMAT